MELLSILREELYDLFKIVNEAELERAFRRWIRALAPIKTDEKVSADGKVIKISKSRENAFILSVLRSKEIVKIFF